MKLIVTTLASFIAICSFQTTAATIDNELTAQANEYIKDHRVSLSEAKKRLVIQNSKEPLINQIKQQYSSRLAGIYIEHDPTYKIIVRLKGGQPIQSFTGKVRGNFGSFTNTDLDIPVEFQTGANETLAEGLTRLKTNIPNLKKAFS